MGLSVRISVRPSVLHFVPVSFSLQARYCVFSWPSSAQADSEADGLSGLTFTIEPRSSEEYAPSVLLPAEVRERGRE